MTDISKLMVPRPAMPQDCDTLSAFDRFYDDAIAAGPQHPIDYTLSAPRWQFICHVADTKGVLLHGSGNPEIQAFEPRQPDDTTVFGNQKAVYGASDGLWPMYFAMLDRDNHPMTMINSCVRLEEDGGPGAPLYFFSISQHALEAKAFRTGTLYFLPRQGFVQQPPGMFGGRRVYPAQWVSHEAVRPLAKVTVAAEDFPLLWALRGHHDVSTFERARNDPDGFPWVDA